MQMELPHPRTLTLFLTVLPSLLPFPMSSIWDCQAQTLASTHLFTIDHPLKAVILSWATKGMKHYGPHTLFCPRMLQNVIMDKALHRKERPLWPPCSVLLVLFIISCFKLKSFPSGVSWYEWIQHNASFQIITCKNKRSHFNKPITVMFWNRFFALVCVVIAKMSPLSSLDIYISNLQIAWRQFYDEQKIMQLKII